MKFEMIHHLTLHFPIVMPVALGLFGVMTLKEQTPGLHRAMRIGGWVTVVLASVAALTGILSAPGWFGGEGPEVLSHHRWLGVTAWSVIVLAAWCYDRGVVREESDLRSYGVAMWWVAALAAWGAGHWGGVHNNPDVVPAWMMP